MPVLAGESPPFQEVDIFDISKLFIAGEEQSALQTSQESQATSSTTARKTSKTCKKPMCGHSKAKRVNYTETH